jgi:Zn-dependent protease
MLRLGHFFGVPIYFAPSWLLIAILLAVYYAPIVRDVVPGTSTSSSYLVAAAFSVLFAGCVLGHEIGHTAVSLALHRPVRRIVIFLLGGISEIEQEPERPRDEFLIAAAGPFVSLLLAAAAGGGFELVQHASLPGVLLALLFWSNLIVAAFNLIPGLPLDGGFLLRSLVWAVGGSRNVGSLVAAWGGRVVAIGVAVFGLFADRTSSWGLTAGVLSFAMAAYLWFGATQSLRLSQVMSRVPDLSIDSLMRPGLLVPADVSVAEALRRAWTGNVRGLVVVDAADHPRAIVDEARIGAVPPDRRPWTRLVDVARGLEPGLVLPTGLSGQELLEAVRATPAHEYLVVHADGSPAGILATADLAAQLNRSGS